MTRLWLRATQVLLILLFFDFQADAVTWVRSDCILTLADGEETPINGYLKISSEGTIVAIESGDIPDGVTGRFVDAMGKIVMPGFVSGHNHLWQSAFRGLASDQELYGWLESLHWTYGDFFEEDDMYTFTLYGALDQLGHGITTTLNHTQNIAPTYAHYLEQFDAEMDAGQNFVFSYVLDRNEKDPARRKAKLVELMEATEAIEDQHPCLGFGLHGVGVYFSAEVHREEVAIAKELDLDMQIHYLEEKDQSLKKGQSQFADLHADGGVWDGLVYAHFIHVTDEILKTSAEAGAKMIWNPLSNGRLASGLADIPRYLDEGLLIGMGVDGTASADVCDPFQNMRMGMYALRMRDSEASVMSCYEVLRLHTLKTAEVLEVEDRVGSLEVGKYGDFLVVEPESPVFDPYASLVMATSAGDISGVWVRGIERVRRGKLTEHSMSKVKKEMVTRVARIVAAQKVSAQMSGGTLSGTSVFPGCFGCCGLGH
ncbi:MAG: amidohydrolase family protein [Verrucomicrobiota bacterium]